MLPPNGLANMLFAKMLGVPTNPIPPEALFPAGMVSDFNLLPQHHPADLSPEHPDFNRRTRAAIYISRQLEVDYQARRIGLTSLLRVIRAFRYDQLQLKAGFARYNPNNEELDNCLNVYATCMEPIDELIVDTLVGLYQQLFEVTEIAITVTPDAALETILREGVREEQGREEASVAE
jgi:hypothetical protein